MADPRRQVIGHRSHENGAIFEKWISEACEYYKKLDVAFIEKTPEPMKPIEVYNRNRGLYIACFTKNAQPDYKGILCDGTGIMFEAKHTDADSIKQCAVTETQWENMDQYEKYGAHCYVMVSLGLRDFYRVPWDTWKRMKELYGHKYMNEHELEPYKLMVQQCKILILEGVELKDEDSKNGVGGKD